MKKNAIRHLPSQEFRPRGELKKATKDLIYGQNDKEKREETFYRIPLDDITPRPINKFSQTRIDEMAASIRNTNNKLIHPIILVKIEDLPEENKIRKEFVEKGIDLSTIKYVISAGERRYRAFLKLRDEERARIGDSPIANPFEKITARILTEEEALREEEYYKDSNNLARHLTPAEGIWFIKDRLNEIETNEQKRNFLIEQNGGSEEGIETEPERAARKFKMADYFKDRLEKEMGVNDWKESTLNGMCTIATNCDSRIADALLNGDIPLREVKNIASLSKQDQVEMLELYMRDKARYEINSAEIKESARKKKQQRITHGDTRKELKKLLKQVKETRSKIAGMTAVMDRKYSQIENDALKKCDAFIVDINECIEKTK